MTTLRWHRAAVDGTRPVTTKVRWHRADATGSALVALQPFVPLVDVEPQEVVTFTAATFPGSAAPTGWVWRQVSGPTVSLNGSGATRSFETPSSLTGATVVLAVAGTLAGVTGPERQVSVTVLPQLSWIRAAGVAGGAWVGSKVVVRAVWADVPILATAPPAPPEPAEPTQDVVDQVLAMQRAHCAPSAWDRFVKSLAANGFPFKVAP